MAKASSAEDYKLGSSFEEVKKKLEADGHVFSSQTDEMGPSYGHFVFWRKLPSKNIYIFFLLYFVVNTLGLFK